MVVLVLDRYRHAVEREIRLVEQHIGRRRAQQGNAAVEQRAIAPLTLGVAGADEGLESHCGDNLLEQVAVGLRVGLGQGLKLGRGVAYVDFKLVGKCAAKWLGRPGIELPLHDGLEYAAKIVAHQQRIGAQDGHEHGKLPLGVVQIARLAQLAHQLLYKGHLAAVSEKAQGAPVRLKALDHAGDARLQRAAHLVGLVAQKA